MTTSDTQTSVFLTQDTDQSILDDNMCKLSTELEETLLVDKDSILVDETTVDSNVSNNEIDVECFKLNDNRFVVGLIDLGEKDYLAKCIHEGISPVSRMDTFSYYIACLDASNNLVNFRFDPINASLLLNKVNKKEENVVQQQDSNSKEESESKESDDVISTIDKTDDNVVSTIDNKQENEVQRQDNASSMFKSTDMSVKNDKYNEMVYTLEDIPPEIEMIFLYIYKLDDVTKKYALYLIDSSTGNIYKNFYLPDYTTCANSVDQPILLCSFQRDKQSLNWTAYFLNEKKLKAKL